MLIISVIARYNYTLWVSPTHSNHLYVIALEKRSNFAVKLIFQYEPLKLVTPVDFVHNSECFN